MTEGRTPTFDDPVSIRRLVLRYMAMAAVSLVAVALVTALVARRIGTSEAVDDADRVTRLIAGSAVELKSRLYVACTYA